MNTPENHTKKGKVGFTVVYIISLILAQKT